MPHPRYMKGAIDSIEFNMCCRFRDYVVVHARCDQHGNWKSLVYLSRDNNQNPNPVLLRFGIAHPVSFAKMHASVLQGSHWKARIVKHDINNGRVTECYLELTSAVPEE